MRFGMFVGTDFDRIVRSSNLMTVIGDTEAVYDLGGVDLFEREIIPALA